MTKVCHFLRKGCNWCFGENWVDVDMLTVFLNRRQRALWTLDFSHVRMRGSLPWFGKSLEIVSQSWSELNPRTYNLSLYTLLNNLKSSTPMILGNVRFSFRMTTGIVKKQWWQFDKNEVFPSPIKTRDATGQSKNVYDYKVKIDSWHALRSWDFLNAVSVYLENNLFLKSKKWLFLYCCFFF